MGLCFLHRPDGGSRMKAMKPKVLFVAHMLRGHVLVFHLP